MFYRYLYPEFFRFKLNFRRKIAFFFLKRRQVHKIHVGNSYYSKTIIIFAALNSKK